MGATRPILTANPQGMPLRYLHSRFSRRGRDMILTPTAFALEVISDTEIDLTWDSIYAVSVERSVDGEAFAEIDTVLAGVNEYTDTVSDSTIQYYYRIRAYNSGAYSEYTSILQSWSDEYFAVVSEMTTAPAASDMVTYDAFVKTLDDNGILSKIDLLRIYGNANNEIGRAHV